MEEAQNNSLLVFSRPKGCPDTFGTKVVVCCLNRWLTCCCEQLSIVDAVYACFAAKGDG